MIYYLFIAAIACIGAVKESNASESFLKDALLEVFQTGNALRAKGDFTTEKFLTELGERALERDAAQKSTIIENNSGHGQPPRDPKARNVITQDIIDNELDLYIPDASRKVFESRSLTNPRGLLQSFSKRTLEPDKLKLHTETALNKLPLSGFHLTAEEISANLTPLGQTILARIGYLITKHHVQYRPFEIIDALLCDSLKVEILKWGISEIPSPPVADTAVLPKSIKTKELFQKLKSLHTSLFQEEKRLRENENKDFEAKSAAYAYALENALDHSCYAPDGEPTIEGILAIASKDTGIISIPDTQAALKGEQRELFDQLKPEYKTLVATLYHARQAALTEKTGTPASRLFYMNKRAKDLLRSHATNLLSPESMALSIVRGRASLFQPGTPLTIGTAWISNWVFNEDYVDLRKAFDLRNQVLTLLEQDAISEEFFNANRPKGMLETTTDAISSIAETASKLAQSVSSWFSGGSSGGAASQAQTPLTDAASSQTPSPKNLEASSPGLPAVETPLPTNPSAQSKKTPDLYDANVSNRPLQLYGLKHVEKPTPPPSAPESLAPWGQGMLKPAGERLQGRLKPSTPDAKSPQAPPSIEQPHTPSSVSPDSSSPTDNENNSPSHTVLAVKLRPEASPKPTLVKETDEIAAPVSLADAIAQPSLYPPLPESPSSTTTHATEQSFDESQATPVPVPYSIKIADQQKTLLLLKNTPENEVQNDRAPSTASNTEDDRTEEEFVDVAPSAPSSANTFQPNSSPELTSEAAAQRDESSSEVAEEDTIDSDAARDFSNPMDTTEQSSDESHAASVPVPYEIPNGQTSIAPSYTDQLQPSPSPEPTGEVAVQPDEISLEVDTESSAGEDRVESNTPRDFSNPTDAEEQSSDESHATFVPAPDEIPNNRTPSTASDEENEHSEEEVVGVARSATSYTDEADESSLEMESKLSAERDTATPLTPAKLKANLANAVATVLKNSTTEATVASISSYITRNNINCFTAKLNGTAKLDTISEELNRQKHKREQRRLLRNVTHDEFYLYNMPDSWHEVSEADTHPASTPSTPALTNISVPTPKPLKPLSLKTKIGVGAGALAVLLASGAIVVGSVKKLRTAIKNLFKSKKRRRAYEISRHS